VKIGLQEHRILSEREEEEKAFAKRMNRGRDRLKEQQQKEEEEKVARRKKQARDAAKAKAKAAAAANDWDGSSESIDGNAAPVAEVDDDKEEAGGKKEEELLYTLDASGQMIKDYRKMYYLSKFAPEIQTFVNQVGGNNAESLFLDSLVRAYLEGLVWCLNYYMRGCVSWTWYFPFHYGPMLQDMKRLVTPFSAIAFSLGQPFKPFQQLLGCLPPLSSALLPRPYRYLMENERSSVLEYYPETFEIDQNGKKAPWEAVVVLPFIDSRRLLEAEQENCLASSLTPAERKRNEFGKILFVQYDPDAVDTYYSCNPEIGLADLHRCQSKGVYHSCSIAPGVCFKAALVPGTVSPCAGYPSLSVLPIQDASIEFHKINVFGRDSRYRSIILKLHEQDFDSATADLGCIVGKSVWVNYPQLHEACIAAVETQRGSWRSRSSMEARAKRAAEAAGQAMDVSWVGKGTGGEKGGKDATVAATAAEEKEKKKESEAVDEIVFSAFDARQQSAWLDKCVDECIKYVKGRRTPGTGGIDPGQVMVKLKVEVLQGMSRDLRTGETKKMWGSSEADVPLQMALWDCPCPDPRFMEQGPVSVSQLLPDNCQIICTAGKLKGTLGRVIHNPVAGQQGCATHMDTSKVVDVRFEMTSPETDFGLAIAASVSDEYFSSRDVCTSLQMSGQALGKVVGSLFVTEDSVDIGLNLKRNGAHQMNGYCRRIFASDAEGGGGAGGNTGAWASDADAVQVVGQEIGTGEGVTGAGGEVEKSYWEYTARAVALIAEYKTHFPVLFARIESAPHERFYQPATLFGGSATTAALTLKMVGAWLQSQPFYHEPRISLTTLTLSKEAIAAVERAADTRTAATAAAVAAEKNNTKDSDAPYINTSTCAQSRLVRGVPVDLLLRGDVYKVTDAKLTYSKGISARLGMRVANLCSTGVPFGLRGTVVAVHTHTRHVEVLFDAEFTGGRALGGKCSAFRGRLCAWAGLLVLSDLNTASKPSNNNKNASTSAKTMKGEGLQAKEAASASANASANATSSLSSLLGVKASGKPPKPSTDPLSDAATATVAPTQEATNTLVLKKLLESAGVMSTALVEDPTTEAARKVGLLFSFFLSPSLSLSLFLSSFFSFSSYSLLTLCCA
jgi:5'-3' exoribonuclease 1